MRLIRAEPLGGRYFLVTTRAMKADGTLLSKTSFDSQYCGLRQSSRFLALQEASSVVWPMYFVAAWSVLVDIDLRTNDAYAVVVVHAPPDADVAGVVAFVVSASHDEVFDALAVVSLRHFAVLSDVGFAAEVTRVGFAG